MSIAFEHYPLSHRVERSRSQPGGRKLQDPPNLHSYIHLGPFFSIVLVDTSTVCVRTKHCLIFCICRWCSSLSNAHHPRQVKKFKNRSSLTPLLLTIKAGNASCKSRTEMLTFYRTISLILGSLALEIPLAARQISPASFSNKTTERKDIPHRLYTNPKSNLNQRELPHSNPTWETKSRIGCHVRSLK